MRKPISVIASLALAAGVTLVAPSVAHAGYSYSGHAKCQLVQIKPHNVVGTVEGWSKENTERKAKVAAEKNANFKVPLGHYKRHCDTTVRKLRNGGGRF